MAMTARGPQFSGPLFHGTSQVIEDAVVPATVHGGLSHWDRTGASQGQPSRENAFATSSEKTAWHFAQHAAQNEHSTTHRVRARVYEVAPHPKMRPGVHEELQEYVAPSFKTTGLVHDIKPGQQGTHPDVNWNRYAGPGQWGIDHNHPTTNPHHTLSSGDRAHLENRDASTAQDEAHMRFKSRIEAIGQMALFDRVPTENQGISVYHNDVVRAHAHDVRHVVNEGHAPAHRLDPELAEAESNDSWNRRKGRRTDMAGGLRRDRAWTGR